MAKREKAPSYSPIADEHEGNDSERQAAYQEMIDRAQYAGYGFPCKPEKVIVHDMPMSDPDVAHVWKPKGND